MTIKYIKKQRIYEYPRCNNFTFEKEYEVIADYRKRQSKQIIADNGLVINDDFGQIQMIFNGDFEITDNEIGKTFVFNY